MGTRRVARGFVTGAILVGIVLAGATCSPTEMSLEITTDLLCPPMRTSIQVGEGADFGGSSVADTPECDLRADPDLRIGSLTITPSGSRDARLRVRVALALNGKSPDDCTPASPADCIVATRSFAFIRHSSRTLPIRLYSDCLGVPCADPANSTCVAGKCVSNDATQIPFQAPPPTAPPPADAAVPDADAAPAALDAAPAACTGPAGDGILVPNILRPTFVRGDATLDWVYVVSGSATQHFWLPLPLVPGQAPTMTPLEPGVGPFAVDGATIWYAFASSPPAPPAPSLVLRGNRGSASPPVPLGFTPMDITFDSTGKGYLLSNADIYTYVPNAAGPNLSETRGGSQIVASAKFLWVLNGTAISAVAISPGNMPPLVANPYARLASDRRTAFAATAGVHGQIVRLDDVPTPPTTATGTPIQTVAGTVAELAVDADHVYWVESSTSLFPLFAIGRSVYSPPVPPTFLPVVVAGYQEIAGLVVDRAAGGCLYFWGRDASGVSALRVLPKGP